jgi:hypothetical protein
MLRKLKGEPSGFCNVVVRNSEAYMNVERCPGREAAITIELPGIDAVCRTAAPDLLAHVLLRTLYGAPCDAF